MGKDLTKNNINTREVLFEKYERYYYRTYDTVCLEECMITRVRIGSGVCQSCAHNQAFDREKHYIICSKIKQAASKK